MSKTSFLCTCLNVAFPAYDYKITFSLQSKLLVMIFFDKNQISVGLPVVDGSEKFILFLLSFSTLKQISKEQNIHKNKSIG